MAIQKQEFYEGAALHMLARYGRRLNLRYDHPFFLVNDGVLLHLKHSTGKRSPWSFTFTPDEMVLLRKRASRYRVWIGLVCGSDGVVAVDYDRYASIMTEAKVAQHLSCARKHREHYEVSGPNGSLERKIPPSDWERILESEIA